MGESEETKQNLRRSKNFDIYVSVYIGCYNQYFVPDMETGH